MTFSLDSGTNVEVLKTSGNTYDFFLKTSEGKTDNFTYVQDNRTNEEVEAFLDFDQLNALRAFWLKTQEAI